MSVSPLNPFDLIIKNAVVYTGGQDSAIKQDVAIRDDRIVALGKIRHSPNANILDATGLSLAPGFIDVHTHDDIEIIRKPQLKSKLSQGITSIIVGNCGISASPIHYDHSPPEPMNLLGSKEEFRYKSFAQYVAAVEEAQPAVNVAALIGHTALRSQAMHELNRSATDSEILQMQTSLQLALEQGAKGLSSGLAYANALNANSDEVLQLVKLLARVDGIYATHLRTEFDGIVGAMNEAFDMGKKANVNVIISHLKCAGKNNWGRSSELIEHLEQASQQQSVACDCYPYNASSSNLDLDQVTDEFDIFISWSEPHPELSGQMLDKIAKDWDLPLKDAAKKLQPAGAVYHCMDEQDVKNIINYEKSMIGSDGLPCDPHPHPRLWGSFPRVLRKYVRESKLLSLNKAIYKMTGLSAKEFKLKNRGQIKPGYYADLVLFNHLTINDQASFLNPNKISTGIHNVWVNGHLSFSHNEEETNYSNKRKGHFLLHNRE